MHLCKAHSSLVGLVDFYRCLCVRLFIAPSNQWIEKKLADLQTSQIRLRLDILAAYIFLFISQKLLFRCSFKAWWTLEILALSLFVLHICFGIFFFFFLACLCSASSPAFSCWRQRRSVRWIGSLWEPSACVCLWHYLSMDMTWTLLEAKSKEFLLFHQLSSSIPYYTMMFTNFQPYCFFPFPQYIFVCLVCW